jgi:hypothetical protein
MIIKHYLLLLLLGLSAYLFAQDESKDEKKFWLGPKFGLDVSSSTADLNSLSDQLKQNYQVGMFLQLGKKIYFQPEIYYASYTTNQTTKINYVKAPMMLGWQIFDIGLISLHLNGGPSYLKQLDSTEKAVINWELGAGVNILGFITTDLRYTFQKGSITQVEQLITIGGMVNLTVGLRL